MIDLTFAFVLILFLISFFLIWASTWRPRVHAFADAPPASPITSYLPHVLAAVAFAWVYLQPGILSLVQALGAKYPHATIFGILALVIGAYHLPSPGQQKTS